MSGQDFAGKLGRMQRSLLFKVIASVVVLAFAGVALSTYAIQQAKYGVRQIEVGERPTENPSAPAGAPVQAKPSAEEVAAREAARSAKEADAKFINEMLAARADWTGVGVLIAELTALVLALIWLGLGLSALGLVGLITLIAWRLKLLVGDFVQLEELRTIDTVLLFAGGVAVLTVSFLVLMELLKIALSAATPITAVARNVVNEAVRLKVSLVFIVLLIFALAALPGLLDAGTPLRYRVQAFLSYATSGTFWIIAILTVFLSVGSVAFEQRDRIIWQTMTKPVSAWQYVLGKWVGVVGVVGVLMLVSASGIFVFTDFLRRQKAVEEDAPFVAREGRYISEDRQILQSQVLTARRIVKFDPPQIDPAQYQKLLDQRIENYYKTNPNMIVNVDDIRAQIESELLNDLKTEYLSLQPGQSQVFIFPNLGDARKTTWLSPETYAKRTGTPIDEVRRLMTEKRIQSRQAVTGGEEVFYVEVRSVTLRYKVQAGGNDPRSVVRVSFELPNQPNAVVNIVPLNTILTLPIPPSAVDDTGKLFVQVTNGDIVDRISNAGPLVFPPDGLEVRYSVGTYQMNFARVMVVLWLKLAFLAMAAIVAATFLSFPIASMIAFGVLFVAESAGFIWEALNYYDATVDGKFDLFRFIIRSIALPIAWVFKFYADINPIENLADGRLVSWAVLWWTALIMVGTSVILYGIGVLVFRRRELATYSGQ